jgi:hypothetical protein
MATDRTYTLIDLVESWAATEDDSAYEGTLPIDSVPTMLTVRSANLYRGFTQEPSVVSPWNTATISDAAPPPSGAGGNACF